MKLLSGILGLTLTSVVALASANAADLSGPAMGGLKDGPFYGPNWAGFYFGANVGGAWSDLDSKWLAPAPKDLWNNNTSGLLGGIQWGYNIQHDSFVFGPEFDVGYMGLNHTTKGNVVPDTSFIGEGVYWDATLRVGYGFDRALVYAKGGLAAYDGHTGLDTVALNSTDLGWTYGAGVEYKINPSWSVKAEYLHYNFEPLVVTAPTPLPGSVPITAGSQHLDIDTVKVGINYFPGYVYEPLK